MAELFPVENTMKALPIVPGPMITVTGSYRERRSFAFFCCQTGQQLSNALGAEKTHQLILQASHCDEGIRSAVIALGSIGERFMINNLLTLDNEQANACHHFAHLQYYKALKRLRERISDKPEGSANMAIISCFLFTVFEFLQGNDTASLIHLRSGLDILRHGQKTLAAGVWTALSEQDPLMQEILKIFSIMDMQATVWLGLKIFQAPIMIPPEGFGHDPASVDHFSTLDEASESLEHRIFSTYHFRRLFAVHHSGEPRDQAASAVYAEKGILVSQLQQWSVSFEALIQRLWGELSAEMSQRIIVLKINYETDMLILTACLHASDQKFYADHELEFRKIVALAKAVVRPTQDLEHIVAANNSKNPLTIFSFYIGVIQPLYFTAINCQNLDVCREAIAMLSSSPWREGAWDSATMGRIAARRVQKAGKGCVISGFPMKDRQALSNMQEHVLASGSPSMSDVY